MRNETFLIEQYQTRPELTKAVKAYLRSAKYYEGSEVDQTIYLAERIANLVNDHQRALRAARMASSDYYGRPYPDMAAYHLEFAAYYRKLVVAVKIAQALIDLGLTDIK